MVATAVVVAALAWLTPANASADAGIPVGILFWPASWLLFPLVVLVETVVAQRMLKLAFWPSLRLSAKANAWSTGAGVPVACFVMFFVGLALGLAGHAWSFASNLFLGSSVFFDGLPSWAAFGGPALLCIPCYWLSVRIEHWSAAKSVPKEDAWRWSQVANRLTYGSFLVILTIAAIVTALRRHG